MVGNAFAYELRIATLILLFGSVVGVRAMDNQAAEVLNPVQSVVVLVGIDDSSQLPDLSKVTYVDITDWKRRSDGFYWKEEFRILRAYRIPSLSYWGPIILILPPQPDAVLAQRLANADRLGVVTLWRDIDRLPLERLSSRVKNSRPSRSNTVH